MSQSEQQPRTESESGRAPVVRRRGGAPLGNFNATRYPWRAFWKRRALRKEDRWVLPLLADYVEAITVDLGGPSAVSAMQARTVELAMLARGCTLLVMAQATQQGTGIAGARRSVQGRRGDLVQRKSEADLASVLSKFMSVELAALRALGLERRPREVPSLRAYLAARAETPDSAEGT